jgi:hypothetical protein
LGLVVFGFLFNGLVAWLHRNGHSDGYTWLLVVIGVTATVLLAGFVIGWKSVLVLFACFAASGLPLAIGDMWRHWQAVGEFVQYRSNDANEETEGMGQ